MPKKLCDECKHLLTQSSPALDPTFKKCKSNLTCDCLPYEPELDCCFPNPLEDGPYAVGYQEFLIPLGHPSVVTEYPINGRNYTFRVMVVFPVCKKAARGLPPTAYRISTCTNQCDTVYPITGDLVAVLNAISTVPFQFDVAVDGTNLNPPKKEEFPLIVLLPGTSGDPFAGMPSLEKIVSHGFIIVGVFPIYASVKEESLSIALPNFNTNIPTTPPPPIPAVQNSQSLAVGEEQYKAAITWATTQSRFSRFIDANKIIAFGISRGTFTILGGNGTPVPSAVDPRIKGLLMSSFAPPGTTAGAILVQPEAVTIPFIGIRGRLDTLLPLENDFPAYYNIASPTCSKYEIVITNGEHSSTSNPCPRVAWFDAMVAAITQAINPLTVAAQRAITAILVTRNSVDQRGCTLIQTPPPLPPAPYQARVLVDPSIASDIQTSYFIAFSKVYVEGDARYLPYLTKKYLLTNPLFHDNIAAYLDSCSATLPTPPVVPLPLDGRAFITTTSLPAGQIGVPYAQVVMATGGLPPYVGWRPSTVAAPPAVTTLLPLPVPGLFINSSNGVISGTPTTAGTFNFSVVVNDQARLATLPVPLTIVINP